MKNLFPAIATVLLFGSCSSQPSTTDSASTQDSSEQAIKSASSVDSSNATAAAPSGKMADAATIMGRKQVPILCYHHIKDVDVLPKNSAGYTVTVNQFKAQMKALADSGYHSVTPEQVHRYLAFGSALPERPVMITFDDTDEEQFTVGKTEMDKYGFKGVYFIMTISIGRPRYMTKEQIKQLSDEGHVIACHTWDHHRTDRYIAAEHMVTEGGKQKKVANDWDVQLTNTKKKLEEITGKPVEYFAYPFGVWSAEGIPEIKKRGFKLAFQLATKRDEAEPLYTVRRIIVAPSWNGPGLIRVMKSSFQ